MDAKNSTKLLDFIPITIPFSPHLFSGKWANDFVSLLELKADYDYDSCPENRPIVLSTKFDFPELWGSFHEQYSRQIGSCYGFICILVGHFWDKTQSVYISNPLLGEYVKLSVPQWEKRNRDVVYGFCSGQSSGQHKVLRSVLKKYRGRPEVTELEVYTLGVDEKWRMSGEGPFPRRESFGNVTINGALHWMNDEDPRAKASIYSFDTGT
ncbi:hypothetical protein RND71_012971 [Anisodus tanguticus]|uniref:F-box associated beta-propeller type 3 domain-containing protein n=1 Tax=Anisodus tanguticus TaxID=243964 RepID=A0AAE1SEC1_9SOLA|nr:hypothetical protein RND71_012971 [Anisodus tanguticus]